jgi:Flp pilus assembly protein TadB
MASFAVVVSAVLASLSTLLLVRPSTSLPDLRPPAADRRGGAPSTSVLHLVAAVGAAAAVLLVVPGAAGLAVAVLAAAAVWWRSRRWESAAVRRRRSRLEEELPHVVDLMTAALTAGAAPTTALGAVARVVDAPMSEELDAACARLSLGADPTAVWASMAGHPQLGRLGTTLLRSAESGAPVAESLLRLAEDLRARERAGVEERVRQVEVKAAVPLGVCLLPSFVLIGVVPLVAGSVSGLLLR